jgi:hypothetical protein
LRHIYNVLANQGDFELEVQRVKENLNNYSS